MRTKTEFYRIYFEQLARRGFQPKRTDSVDYIADIYHKGQLIAYYTKADTIQPCTKAQLIMKDKQYTKLLSQINEIATASALQAGICTECPYNDKTDKMQNGWYKLAEYNNVILAAREHHLFGYVFNTYNESPDGSAENRRVYYSREFAGQDFAVRSGLVDERALFTESELRVIHSELARLNVLDNHISNDERIAVGEVIEKIEDIVPDLWEQDYDFSYEAEFSRDAEAEMEVEY